MKSPAFQFYPNDFLGGVVATYSLEEIGLYMSLLAFDWNLNGLPTDREKLAKMSRVSARKFRKLWEVVGANFTERDGRYHNPRLDLERAKQAENRAKKKHAADSRWNAGADAGALQVECSPTPTTSSVAVAVPKAEAVVVEAEPDGPLANHSYAIRITVTANNAIAEKWGERPAVMHHGAAEQMAADLRAAGVPLDIARRSILDQITRRKDEPPRSIHWFRPGIEQAWQQEQQRRLDATTTLSVPRSLTATGAPLNPFQTPALLAWAAEKDAEAAKEKARA